MFNPNLQKNNHMSKYSLYATKADYEKAFKQLEELQPKLTFNLDWKKIKRVSLDELSTLIGILNRKLGEIKAETEIPDDCIEVSKIRYIDNDNIKIGVELTKGGKQMNFEGQYILSSNSVHFNQGFYDQAEKIGIDLDEVRDGIENRTIKIN